MPNLIIAIAIVVGGLWLIRKFAKLQPSAVPGFMQKLAGAGIIAFSGLLAMRGQMNMAVPVFLFGLGLVGKSAVFPQGFHWPGARSSGQKSRVSTTVLMMELDHDSGGMEGEVLGGPLRGRKLSTLSEDELAGLHRLCGKAGDQSQALYEAWLDRNKPGWRESWGRSSSASAAPGAGPMSADEARAVLGVKPQATDDDVRAAHRRLMKEFHPDKGGSDYLAAKINAAKDVLLGS